MKVRKRRIMKVGSRGSPLALAQVKEVFSLLAKVKSRPSYEMTTFKTAGDTDKTTSLLTNPSDDFFSNTLDEAVLAGTIDIAIHSAKDLPKNLRPGLKIFALTKTFDDTDAFVGKVLPESLPAGSRIGTSSLLRKQQILALNSGVEIVDIRGTIEERLDLLDKGKIDGLIVAACALKRLGLSKRIVSILPWEGTPLQGQLAVVGREDDVQSAKIFEKIDVRRTYGKVTLVGAGPGDPQLITLSGIEAIQQADSVFFDFLVHKSLLDYAPGALKIDAGKRKSHTSMPQSEILRLMKEAVFKGQNVVRLKGGDPLVFGRGAEEIAYLKSYHIDVEVVPGVSSATGIPAQLGIPLTTRGISSSVAFLSGHGQGENPQAPLALKIPEVDTIVFLMGLTKLGDIVKSLLESHRPISTVVTVISSGTCIGEKIVTGNLSDIENKVAFAALAQPALIIVGPTASFYKDSSKDQKTILYTGTYPEKYKHLGRIIHFPMITISPAKIKNPNKILNEIKKADTVLLTSRCGVKHFFEFLAQKRFAMENLRLKNFVVIGADTEKQLGVYGFTAQLVSKDETSEGLYKAMKKALKLKGRRIVFPRSSLPNPYLTQYLAKTGAKILEFVVYENTKPAHKDLPTEKIDQVIFTSPSTFNNFLADYGSVPGDWEILAKGKRTQRELIKAGYSAVKLVSV